MAHDDHGSEKLNLMDIPYRVKNAFISFLFLYSHFYLCIHKSIGNLQLHWIPSLCGQKGAQLKKPYVNRLSVCITIGIPF